MTDRIRIRQTNSDPYRTDSDPQHCAKSGPFLVGSGCGLLKSWRLRLLPTPAPTYSDSQLKMISSFASKALLRMPKLESSAPAIKAEFRIRTYSLNPDLDPAKNLNLDLCCFLTLPVPGYNIILEIKLEL